MKKLSLILALVLCFTLVLVACNNDGEESSVAESTAESKVESKVESEDESKEASEDESSEPEDESSEAGEPLEAGMNVAAGKTYVISQLFRQDETWQWNENSPIAYPDEDGKSLTDGAFAPDSASYDDVAWAGFHSQGPDNLANGYDWITVDLGGSTELVKFAVQVATTATGAGGPQTIEIYVSEDGENWGDVVATISPLNPSGANTEYLTVELTEAVIGQYVQFRLKTTGYWMHIAEVEAYNAAKIFIVDEDE